MRTRRIYEGKVIDLNLEAVELPNGVACELEIVHHPGGAAAVAIDENGRVCLLRHYRHAAGGWLWELPAGRRDPGEAPLTTARRELLEEAGVRAQQWDALGTLVSSPAVFTEVLYLYLARDVRVAQPCADEDEVFEVHWVPFAEALTQACDDRIRDAKTVIGLFRAQYFLQHTPSHPHPDPLP